MSRNRATIINNYYSSVPRLFFFSSRSIVILYSKFITTIENISQQSLEISTFAKFTQTTPNVSNVSICSKERKTRSERVQRYERNEISAGTEEFDRREKMVARTHTHTYIRPSSTEGIVLPWRVAGS